MKINLTTPIPPICRIFHQWNGSLLHILFSNPQTKGFLAVVTKFPLTSFKLYGIKSNQDQNIFNSPLHQFQCTLDHLHTVRSCTKFCSRKNTQEIIKKQIFLIIWSLKTTPEECLEPFKAYLNFFQPKPMVQTTFWMTWPFTFQIQGKNAKLHCNFCNIYKNLITLCKPDPTWLTTLEMV